MTPQCTVRFHYTTKHPLIIHSSRAVIAPARFQKKLKRKNTLKCVIVGDKAVGKTALVVSYSNNSFPKDYVPTAYDHYNVEVQVDGRPIRLDLCDTAGEDHLNPLRNLCYPGTDVMILCFSVVKPSSFNSALTRWAEELTRLRIPVVLVGTQCDLRTCVPQERSVSVERANELAKHLGAPYVETSAKDWVHLKEAFDLAITLALRNRKKSFWRRLLCF